MRILRWRAAWAVAIVIVGGVWLALTGGPSHVIQVQFGMAPEVLEGAEVLIDGRVAGAIERRGARTVNGFRVEPGEHTVEVRRDGYGSLPATVDTRPAGGTALLMVDLVDMADAPGGVQTTFVLR